MGTAVPTSTASPRSHWALPDLNRKWTLPDQHCSKSPIAVGAAGPQRTTHTTTITNTASNTQPQTHNHSSQPQHTTTTHNHNTQTHPHNITTCVCGTVRGRWSQGRTRTFGCRTHKQNRKPQNSRPWQHAPHHGMKSMIETP